MIKSQQEGSSESKEVYRETYHRRAQRGGSRRQKDLTRDGRWTFVTDIIVTGRRFRALVIVR